MLPALVGPPLILMLVAPTCAMRYECADGAGAQWHAIPQVLKRSVDFHIRHRPEGRHCMGLQPTVPGCC